MPSLPQKVEAWSFPANFCTRKFRGGVILYAATKFIVALSLVYSDITRFRPWSPIARENHLDQAEKNSKICSDFWHRWRFWSAFGHFGTHLAENFRLSKSSWMMGAACSREMPSCSDIDLAEIRRSSKISSWIWTTFSGEVTVFGRPGRGTPQAEKSPRLSWATPFLTVAYYGVYSLNVSVRMSWISFGALPSTKWNLMIACVSMLLNSRNSPDMLPFSLCNKKELTIRHMNRPLFPATLSIPS